MGVQARQERGVGMCSGCLVPCSDSRATEAIHARYTGAGWKVEYIAVLGGGATLGVGVELLRLGYMELGLQS